MTTCPGNPIITFVQELPAHPRIAIIGAGALGCYYGGRLAQHGHDVHFLLRSDYQQIKAYGLQVQSHAGDFFLPPAALQVYDHASAMPRADLVLVTLKTTANGFYEPLIRPLIHEQTVILTLQNGLGNEQQLAELFGTDRIIGGLAFVCINRLAPGRIYHSDYGLIKIGEYLRPSTARLRQIAGMFGQAQVPCETLENLDLGRWEKLIWNIPFNGLGAALDLTTDRLVNNPAGQVMVRRIMEEVVAIAHTAGIPIDSALVEKNIQKTLTMGAYRSSMQIDRQTQRPLELEAIIGRPLQTARHLKVPTPYLEMLYDMIATQVQSIANPVIISGTGLKNIIKINLQPA